MPRWVRLVLLAVVVAGMLASFYQGWQRHQVEQANRQVELTAEYNSLAELAARTGVSRAELSAELRDHGVRSIFFKEQRLPDLQGIQLQAASGYALLADPAWRERIASRHLDIVPEYTYLVIWDPATYRQVATQLKIKVPGVQDLGQVATATYLVGSPLSAAGIEEKKIGLGLPLAEIEAARRAGLGIIVQVRSWPGADASQVERVMDTLQPLGGDLHAVFFDGTSLPGYPEALPVLARKVQELDTLAGIIEFSNQQGLPQLVQMVDKRAARLHSVTPQELQLLAPAEVADRFTLAAAERDIRVLLLRFYTDRPGDLLEINLGLLDRLRGSLAAEGLDTGRAVPFGPLPVSRWVLLLVGLAVVAGGIWLVQLWGFVRLGWVLGGLAALVWLGILVTGFQLVLARQAMAFAAVVIYPALSVSLLFPRQRCGLSRAIGQLVLMTAFSLVGALLMAGLLSDVSFMLKVNTFLGVKAAHAVPLVLIGLYFWLWREDRQMWVQKVRDLWTSPLFIRSVIIVAVLAGIGYIYLARTGNEAASVSGIELQMRQLLDTILGVRPRTKEFLIGHPFMMLTLYLGYRQRYLPLLLIGSIGQVSLVNTFAHIHTPLVVSLARTGNGLGLGIVVGLVFIAAWELLALLARRSWPRLGAGTQP